MEWSGVVRVVPGHAMRVTGARRVRVRHATVYHTPHTGTHPDHAATAPHLHAATACTCPWQPCTPWHGGVTTACGCPRAHAAMHTHTHRSPSRNAFWFHRLRRCWRDMVAEWHARTTQATQATHTHTHTPRANHTHTRSERFVSSFSGDEVFWTNCYIASYIHLLLSSGIRKSTKNSNTIPCAPL